MKEFKDLDCGDEFKFRGANFRKTGDVIVYGAPIHCRPDRPYNSICLDVNKRCVIPDDAQVELIKFN